MPSLKVLQGPDRGCCFEMVGGKATLLGRASKDLPLTDFTVSRRHAELRQSGRSWEIHDLKSANGTYLNDKRIERPLRMKHGDLVRMGGTVLVWDGSEDRGLHPTGEGAFIAADLVDLDAGGSRGDASIIGSVGMGDDSMILASPAAAEAVRSWRVMSTLLEAVATVASPHQLAQRVMDVLFEEVPAGRGFILLKDPKTGRYETEVVHYKDDTREKIRTSRKIVDHVIERKEAILTSSVIGETEFDEDRDFTNTPGKGLQSVICVPVVAREEVLGVIYVDCDWSMHIYTEEQLRLVASIGKMAGLAIEDARLVSQRLQTERLAATGETVAALSHYIKNILQGLSGGSEIIEMGLNAEKIETVNQGWRVVHGNLDKIYSLTMNMLAFAKRREPRWEPVQVNTLTRDVLKLVAHRANDKGVMLKSDLGEPMPAIQLDEAGIHQVVLNILTNAIDAVEEDSGVVTVKTSFDEDADAIILTFGDNGPGIPDEERDRVFDAFYSTKGHAGTGLGLAVAKKIVDEHLGKISINAIPSHGTVIRVTLPVAPRTDLDNAATHGPGGIEPHA